LSGFPLKRTHKIVTLARLARKRPGRPPGSKIVRRSTKGPIRSMKKYWATRRNMERIKAKTPNRESLFLM